MGRTKKTDKNTKNDTVDGEKELEPYQCTGQFQNDFHELCVELQMYREIPIIPRAKRPTSPSHVETNQAPTRKGKEDKNKNQPVEAVEEESIEEKEAMELLGFKPKTFTLKNHIDLLRPCIQVEMDNPDKQDTVTEVFVRSWKLELPILTVLGKCFAKLQKLHTLHLWRAGLSSSIITELATVLSQLEQLKHLNLEGNNYIAEENYAELIRPDSQLAKLSLRFNQITEKGATLLSEQIGNLTNVNSRLICLDLSSNAIKDDGAIALAQALRTNRTLLSLTLSNNHIGDRGGIALAHVCSRFFLSHAEVVQRRRLLSFRPGVSPDRESKQSRPTSSIQTPPPSRKGADRPTSTRSADKDKKTGRDSKLAKGKKELDKKVDDKTAKGKPGAKDESKGKGKASASTSKDSAVDSKLAKPASKGSRGNRVKMTTPQPDAEPDGPMVVDHPLLEKAELIEGSRLLIPGNYVLAILNLSRNELTTASIDQWKTAIAYQIAYINLHGATGTGLMKLMLSNNNFSEEYENFKVLDDIMQGRNPLRPSVADD